ncbi:hypothetical protein D3C86_1419650 [compost metagenome]
MLRQHEYPGRQHEAARHAQLAERREVAAPLAVDRLADQQHAAAPFTARRRALQDAQHHHRHRRPEADLLVGGKQADQEGGRAHQAQRPLQRQLAAVAVADVAEDHAAQRPCQKAHREPREGAHGAQQRVRALGKKQLAKHQRGRRAIDEKVVPLHGVARDRGRHHAPGALSFCFVFGGQRRPLVCHRHCRPLDF